MILQPTVSLLAIAMRPQWVKSQNEDVASVRVTMLCERGQSLVTGGDLQRKQEQFRPLPRLLAVPRPVVSSSAVGAAKMEGAGWQMAGASGDNSIAVASYLDFLQDDLLGGGAPAMTAQMLLDSNTLAAAQAAGTGEQRQRKKPKREPSGHLDAAADGSNDEDFDASDDDDEGATRSKGGKRRASAAAQNKANREKARREKINDRWVQQNHILVSGNGSIRSSSSASVHSDSTTRASPPYLSVTSSYRLTFTS
jgi:hypothetical protein